MTSSVMFHMCVMLQAQNLQYQIIVIMDQIYGMESLIDIAWPPTMHTAKKDLLFDNYIFHQNCNCWHGFMGRY